MRPETRSLDRVEKDETIRESISKKVMDTVVGRIENDVSEKSSANEKNLEEKTPTKPVVENQADEDDDWGSLPPFLQRNKKK